MNPGSTRSVISIDETGNTGANLLDPDQPVFVLASVGLSEEDATALVGAGGREQKFTTLRRSTKGRQTIINTLNSDLMAEDQILVMGIHKAFMITAKIVDLLMEPLAYEDGINLYERGANLALANMLHFCLPVFLGKTQSDNLNRKFVAMIREPSQSNIDEFYRLVNGLYTAHQDKDYAKDLAVLVASERVAKEYSSDWGDNHLDPAIPAFVMHAATWTERLRRPFSIVHDESKPLANIKAILEAMMSTTESPITIGYDRRKILFPLMADGIDFGDSKKIPQLRVADLLAGSAGYCLRAAVTRMRDDFVTELLNTRALSGTFLPVWPEKKITPKELGTEEIGGIDPINHMADYVTARLGKKVRLI